MAEPWLAEGSANVQQQALRDFTQAMRNFFDGAHARPGWRRKHKHEGFRVTHFTPAAHVRRLSRRWAEVQVPKVGWVRFRWSRPVPDCKSYRVTRDRAGRWHIGFAQASPPTIGAPQSGQVVGVDRGVTVTAALSTGEMLVCPRLSSKESARMRKAHRRMARAPRHSAAQRAERSRIARLSAREADMRKDWVEKTSTMLARRFDVIRIEDLRIMDMTKSASGTVEQPGKNVRQKASLNRGILASGWGMLAQRIEQKAPGRVRKVRAAYTSLRCSDCGWIDKDSRQNQAVFLCTSCGFTLNADINAAINIAAGQVCAADPRPRSRAGGTTRRKASKSVREPQPLAVGIPRLQVREDVKKQHPWSTDTPVGDCGPKSLAGRATGAVPCDLVAHE